MEMRDIPFILKDKTILEAELNERFLTQDEYKFLNTATLKSFEGMDIAEMCERQNIVFKVTEQGLEAEMICYVSTEFLKDAPHREKQIQSTIQSIAPYLFTYGRRI